VRGGIKRFPVEGKEIIAMISQRSIQEVQDAAKIEEVVGDFVELRRRGVNLAGLCPFHNEKTPSFYVSPSKNIFKCFGCARGGTPVNFVMEHENLSFPDAIRYLARKYRIELEETAQDNIAFQEQQLLERLYLVNQFAQVFFAAQMQDTDMGKSVCLSYFKHRGFDEATIEKFGLGFAPAERDRFTQVAVAKGYSIELLRKLGLTSSFDQDFFRNRAMFPIHNLSGKVIAFAGRIMHKDPKAPKYINSPETDIYTKSKVLYGAFFAKKAIRQQDECFLVEGYTDVISLHRHGIENVVASSGTSLTSDQVKLIKRFGSKLTILYDGDAAGIRAALRGLDMALEEDLNVRVVLLPDGEDPDSYIQKVGKDRFLQYVRENARDIIQLETSLLLEQAGNDPTRRAAVISQIAFSISRINNPLRRDEYVRNVRETLKVDEGRLLMEINNFRKRDYEKFTRKQELQGTKPQESDLPVQQPTGPAQTAIGDVFQEKDLVRLLITAGNKVFDEKAQVSVAEYVLMNIEDVLGEFDHPLYRRVVMEIRTLALEKREVHLDFFLNHPDPEIVQLAVNFSSSPYEYSENWAQKWEIFLSQSHPDDNQRLDAENLIKRFKLRKIKRFKARNAEKLNALMTSGGPSSEVENCLRLHLMLKGIENQLAKELGTVVL
jgi:DNA primase